MWLCTTQSDLVCILNINIFFLICLRELTDCFWILITDNDPSITAVNICHHIFLNLGLAVTSQWCKHILNLYLPFFTRQKFRFQSNWIFHEYKEQFYLKQKVVKLWYFRGDCTAQSFTNKYYSQISYLGKINNFGEWRGINSGININHRATDSKLEQLKLYIYKEMLVPFIYQKNEVFEKLLILQEWDKMTVCWPPT